MEKAVGYIRKSQVRKDKDVPGLERQELFIREYCEQHGIELVGIFEEHKSAWGSKGRMRPSLKSALDAVKAQNAQMLLTWRTDRLTRGGLIGLGDILAPLHDYGAFFRSTSEGLSSQSPQERLLLGVAVGIADAESDNTSKRVKAARNDEAKAGKAHGGGRRPFGFNEQRNDWDPVEAKLIRQAVEDMLARKVSLNGVARQWTDMGVKTPSGTTTWNASTISRIFKSKRLIGVRVHNGSHHKAEWPPLLTPEEFTALEAVLKFNQAGRVGPNVGPSVLSGLLKCGRCGQKLMAGGSSTRKNIQARYTCKVDQKGRGCGLSIARYTAEEFVIEQVLGLMDELHASGDPLLEPREPSTLEEDRASLKRLLSLYTKGKINEDAFWGEHDRLDARIRAAEKNEKQEVIRLFGSDWWAKADQKERHQALRDIVDSVEVAYVGFAGPKNPVNRITINLRNEWLKNTIRDKMPVAQEVFQRHTQNV